MAKRQAADPPKKRGRPGLFKPEFVEQAKKLTRLGATDAQIADFFGIAVSTLNSWKSSRPDFLEALKGGKLLADSEVADSLFHRARGYSHPEDDIRTLAIGDGVSQIVVTPTIKHYPPDTTACIFWLKNRQPKLWRDRMPEEQDDDEVPQSRTFVFNVIDGRKHADADPPAG